MKRSIILDKVKLYFMVKWIYVIEDALWRVEGIIDVLPIRRQVIFREKI